MRLGSFKGTVSTAKCSALVVLAFEDDFSTSDSVAGKKLAGPIAKLDSALGGKLSRVFERGDIATKVATVTTIPLVEGIVADKLIVVGGGKQDAFEVSEAYCCAGAAAKALAAKGGELVIFDFGSLSPNVAVAAVVGAMNGCVGQDIFRNEKSLKPLDEIQFAEVDDKCLERGFILGESMLLTRDLVNLPANYIYPETFAERAAKVAADCGLEIEVWDELKLQQEKCGSLLGVAAGSARPPRLLILRHRGTTDKPPLALVGKGVTFDSGGLSLKPSEGMMTMKCDMAGAATVLGAMQAIARLNLPQPVVGLVGLVENMVSGSCFKLGDVLTARNGKTIEIHNTDAEGRLVLADVLDVACDENPSQIVDLATLTGACVVALGNDIVGVMSNNGQAEEKVKSAASQSGELVWPLPMHAHFSEQIRSKVADIKNMGEGRWGGAITAAKFLEEFVRDIPWVHLDIAGPAFADSPKPHIDAGASGVMVRTLVQLAQDY